MKRKDVTERTFKCTKCNIATMTAYKKSSRRTPDGHIKHIYCWKCQERTPFVQYRYNVEDV